MNKLKFKKFGWNQVKELSEINPYDYVKNRMVAALAFLIGMILTTLIATDFNNIYIIEFDLLIVVIAFIFYILISFELIKKYYLISYFISFVIPFIYFFSMAIYSLHNQGKIIIMNVFFFTYILIWLFCFIAIKRFDKDKVKTVSSSVGQLLALPIGTIVGLYVSKIDNIIYTYMFLLLISTTFISYIFFQIRYVLNNNKYYRHEIEKR